MRFHSLRTFLIPILSLAVHAAEEKPAAKPAPPPAAVGADLSAYRTADELWNHLEELREEPKVQPQTKEEYLGLVKQWFTGQRIAADAFIKKYPTDPRHYSAQVVALQSAMQLGRLTDAEPRADAETDEQRKLLAAIIDAAEAPDEVKGEASFVRTILLTERLEAENTGKIATFLREAQDFLAKYAGHKLAPQMRQALLDVATQATIPEAEVALQKLGASEDQRIATLAGQMFTRRKRMREFATKPLELKFTATDGSEVSVEKLRGKVVLVDFWASWCAPCVAATPIYVTAYQLLHDKGFEIVGISLDAEREDMEAIVKKYRVPWRQYFDGKAWHNEISSAYGINALPVAWLLDKKGMVRALNVPAESLVETVKKLLAE